MGYCINLIKSTAKIKIENEDKVLKTFKKWQEETPRLGFTNKSDILDSDSIEELLENLRYECDTDSEYVYITDFFGEKYGEELTIHKVLAPFVEDGGYIEYKGEDGDVWRHLFKNGEVREIHPTIKWEE